MFEMTAQIRRPARLPISIMVLARSSAASRSRMKAPLPQVTSSTMASAPLASFLLMMELAMSGLLSTVAVTSRSA